jgi:hypothetical protein
MSAERMPSVDDGYAGSRSFVSVNGLAGFRLGTEGDLFDFFASPLAEASLVQDMMAMAIQLGAYKLVTYEHPLVAEFFKGFGFQPTCIVRPAALNDVPPGWVPEACLSETDPLDCPGFLYMALRDAGLRPASLPAGDTRHASSPEGAMAPDAPCARCRRRVASRTRAFGVFGGYDCPHCGFIHVCGQLTLGPHRPREQTCPCGSGKAFAECHGS